jgi:hypothetical protein
VTEARPEEAWEVAVGGSSSRSDPEGEPRGPASRRRAASSSPPGMFLWIGEGSGGCTFLGPRLARSGSANLPVGLRAPNGARIRGAGSSAPRRRPSTPNPRFPHFGGRKRGRGPPEVEGLDSDGPRVLPIGLRPSARRSAARRRPSRRASRACRGTPASRRLRCSSSRRAAAGSTCRGSRGSPRRRRLGRRRPRP